MVRINLLAGAESHTAAHKEWRARMVPEIFRDEAQAERDWILAGLDFLLMEHYEDNQLRMYTSPFGGAK